MLACTLCAIQQATGAGSKDKEHAIIHCQDEFPVWHTVILLQLTSAWAFSQYSVPYASTSARLRKGNLVRNYVQRMLKTVYKKA